MVTTTGYSTREGACGKQSLLLHAESDLIPKSSKTSGRTYFITRKAKVLALTMKNWPNNSSVIPFLMTLLSRWWNPLRLQIIILVKRRCCTTGMYMYAAVYYDIPA